VFLSRTPRSHARRRQPPGLASAPATSRHGSKANVYNRLQSLTLTSGNLSNKSTVLEELIMIICQVDARAFAMGKEDIKQS